MLHGALLVDKPTGITSFDLLRKLKLLLRPHFADVRLGHGGTLDPFATGLMLVFCGRGLKLAEFFLASEKSYTGVIEFGRTTPSFDPDTPPEAKTGSVPSNSANIAQAMAEFTDKPYLQIPPMFSAKKVQGKRLYALARSGQMVARIGQTKVIYEFDLKDYKPPLAGFTVRVSAGTYIRTLAADLADHLGTIAHLRTLRRTQSAEFLVDNALTLDALAERLEQTQVCALGSAFVDVTKLVCNWPTVHADAQILEHLKAGRQERAIPPLIAQLAPSLDKAKAAKDQRIAVLHAGTLRAILTKSSTNWRSARIF